MSVTSIPLSTGNPLQRRRRIMMWLAGLGALFAFRLVYGLSREFFFEDETQIFLLGLRYYATGAWPYFGPDIVWTRSEIPGALQALLVGVPLRIVPAPESAYVLVNVLSFSGLSVFAWYICERLPSLPKWLVWGWLMTLPWTLEWSTHLLNPSYALTPALLFFLGFFETVPTFRLGKMPVPVGFLLMGAAVAWIMQVHASWPLLLPYAAFAWLSRWRSGAGALAAGAGGFAGGALLTGSLLLPTLLEYGIDAGSGGTHRNLDLHAVSPVVMVDTLARLFSFPSLEIWRYMATDDGKRLMFLLGNIWIAPLAVVAWLAGILQPLWMLREWFRARPGAEDWRLLKWLLVGSIVMIYASYWFVIEPPQAHAFYVLSPLSFMFAAYCFAAVDSTRTRRLAAGLLAVNIAFHIGQAWIHFPEISLYRQREVVATAVRLKEPQMFGHRRDFAIGGGPASLQDPSRPWDAPKDVELSDVQFRLGPRRVALWTLTLRNTSARVAYRDVLYQTHYLDANGQLVEERHDRIKQIFQPGESAAIEIIDNFAPGSFASATIHVLAAEALIPIPEEARR